MNPPTTVAPDVPFDPQALAPADRPTRPLYWSVRRELWENRAVSMTPLIVTAVVLLGCLGRLFDLPGILASRPPLGPGGMRAALQPFHMAPAPIMLTTFLVGLFYALDALYGERRDRSLLFWKSLPVSDRVTVLSKAAIPLGVLPLMGFVLSLATLAVLVLFGTAVLLMYGMSPGPLWHELRLLQLPLVMLYGLTVHVLWFAPIYAWLLLISAWARRMPVLWAVLPPLVISMVEKLVFNSSNFASFLGYRVNGAMKEAFAAQAQNGNVDRLKQLDPVGFLTTPGLWLGLAFTAACLAAAVRLRRHREPL